MTSNENYDFFEIVLEAMKMEQPLTAHKAGKISNLVAEIGETVASGTKLCLRVD